MGEQVFFRRAFLLPESALKTAYTFAAYHQAFLYDDDLDVMPAEQGNIKTDDISLSWL